MSPTTPLEHPSSVRPVTGTDSSDAATSGVRGTLPGNVLRDARKRLKIVTLVGIAMLAVGLVMSRIVGPAVGIQVSHLEHGFFTVFAVVAATASALLFLAARSRRFHPQRLLDIGLVYMIVVALGIAINHYWTGITVTSKSGLSWVAVWVMVYSMIVPSTPRRTYVAAFIAGSMPFLGVGVAILRGHPAPPTAQILVSNVTVYMMVAIAGIPSLIIHKLARQVQKAQEMGSYHLERMIGRGGMGEVWLARHRMLARPAAIKLIRPEMLGAASSHDAHVALKRFEHEAQATAALCSPYTVELYDFGITREGTFYYVMELLDGLDLRSLVQKYGPVPPERAAFLLRQACHSLADAHHSGLVHRDIKPANLFACRKGLDVDFVKVLDFGLVKASDGRDRTGAQLTADNVTTGTPAFLPPETVTGEAEVGPRSDIYALGCVAYWLVTGQLVFSGDTSMNIILKHVREKPVPPSQRTELAVPESLERIILSCLEKKPEDRPADALSLSRALGESGLEERWTPTRALEWWDRHLPRGSGGSGTTDGATGPDPAFVLETIS